MAKDSGPKVLPAGTFDYSGFGWGHYVSVTGERIWMVRSDAWARAKAEGVPYSEYDRLKGYNPPYLGD